LRCSPRFWNGHTLIAASLNDRFNKTRDLVELVTLLVETTVPMNALHHFVRQRLQSVKTFSQVWEETRVRAVTRHNRVLEDLGNSFSHIVCTVDDRRHYYWGNISESSSNKRDSMMKSLLLSS
jgi:hypothetical protein